MDISWRAAVLIVAAAFVVFLLAKLLPGDRRKAARSTTVTNARDRARSATTPRDRAKALCDAADAALAAPFGSTRAAAYFMRAMRADPTWPEAATRAASALAGRRARLLRRLMWRRLAAVPWDDEHGPAVRAIMEAITHASRGARSSPHGAVIQRVLSGESLRVPRRGS